MQLASVKETMSKNVKKRNWKEKNQPMLSGLLSVFQQNILW